MKLSHEERRRLRSIEKQLHDDDPDLARRLDEWPPSPWGESAFSVILVIIGAIGVLTGSMVTSFGIVMVSGVIPTCLGVGLSRRHRRQGGRGAGERE